MMNLTSTFTAYYFDKKAIKEVIYHPYRTARVAIPVAYLEQEEDDDDRKWFREDVESYYEYLASLVGGKSDNHVVYEIVTEYGNFAIARSDGYFTFGMGVKKENW